MQKSFNLPCFAAFEIELLVGYYHEEMMAWFMMDIKRVFRGGKREPLFLVTSLPMIFKIADNVLTYAE